MTMSQERKTPVYNIICDESRQTQDRYMVIGGIIINSLNRKSFEDTMQKYRKETNMWSELKWAKVSNQKFDEYLKFVEYFHSMNNTNLLHFHCIIIDNHKINHKKFSKGDKEIGFYKFYYQLLLHCFASNYCNNKTKSRLILQLDRRGTKYSLSELKTILNNGVKKDYGIDYSPFRSIEPVDSKKSEIMQINDIIIGAIGFQKNGYHLIANSRWSKIEIANFIAEQIGQDDLTIDTPTSNKRFTIWNFRLRR